MKKLSILIPTHNRPQLFKRALLSILKNIPEWVEIIVNNDSQDIDEIYHPQVRYYYYCNSDLSKIYKFLLDKAEGEYSYFLEDDDFVIENFYNKIKLENSIYLFYPHNKDLNIFKYFVKIFKKDISIRSHFLEAVEEKFQLGQMIFKTDLKVYLPAGNNINNDFIFFQNMFNVETFSIYRYPIYFQTTDGKDNISFSKFNKDSRFKDIKN